MRQKLVSESSHLLVQHYERQPTALESPDMPGENWNSGQQHERQPTTVQALTDDVLASESPGRILNKAGRQKRPRPFCGQLQLHLPRHLKRKHKTETSVQACLKSSVDGKRNDFAVLRKEGIFKHNRSLVAQDGKNADLIRERNSKKCSKVVVCGHCKGFYNSLHLWRHLKQCAAAQSAAAPSAPLPAQLLAYDKDRSEFKSQVLANFRSDDVGGICTEDSMILRVGQWLWEKSA
jgi:hypothetical protein